LTRKDAELVEAVALIAKHLLRHANKQGWPERHRQILARVAGHMIEIVPGRIAKGKDALPWRPKALDDAKLCLAGGDPTPLKAALRQAEREIVGTALRRTKGHQADAAQLLGITPRVMWHLVAKHGIEVEKYK